MQGNDEKQQVNPGEDAIWIPERSAHSLVNTGTEHLMVFVAASSWEKHVF
jgi:oxalate decarboxylase/phosphoglucose isomerase-like protein (cupin superfamily)